MFANWLSATVAVVATVVMLTFHVGDTEPDLEDMEAGTVKIYRVVNGMSGVDPKPLCSGSLLEGGKVLTAGHCLRRPHLYTYIMEDEDGTRRILRPWERETPIPNNRANPEETKLTAQDDWAVMDIQGPYDPEYTFELACGYTPDLWDKVYSFGFPGNQGFSFTATRGYVHNVNEDVEFHINSSAGMQPGMSGGPTTDVNGNIIGINALVLRVAGATFNKVTSLGRVCEMKKSGGFTERRKVVLQ